MKNGKKLEELKQLEQMLSSDTFFKAAINPYVIERIEKERAEREAAGIINIMTGDGSLHRLSENEKEKIIEKLATLDRNYLPDDKDTRKHNFKIESAIHQEAHKMMTNYANTYFFPRKNLKLWQSILDGQEEEGKFVYKTKVTKGVFYLDDDSTEEKEAQILDIEHSRWKEYERQQREVNIEELFTEMLEDRHLTINYQALICKELFNRNFKAMSKKNQQFILEHIRAVASEVLLRNQMEVLEEFLTNGVQFAKIQDNHKRTAQATRTVLKRISKRLNKQ